MRYFKFSTVILVIGAVIGASAVTWYFMEGREEACLKMYNLINAPIVCEYVPVIRKTGYAEVQQKLGRFIAEEKAAGRADEVALYFRDLKAGPVFGINETTDFAPASLLKLPLAIVFLSWAEREPEILSRPVVFKEQLLNYPQTFVPENQIVVGNEYTVEDLLHRMIAYSDNGAYDALITYLEDSGETGRILETFYELGIIGAEQSPEEIISVRRYGGLFRALYNVSFLNPALSEKILGWLTESDFGVGIVAGVPGDVRVAQKFGERVYDNGVKQLHDCGIIYYPENPYLLCVMTRGEDMHQLTNIISSISRIIYEEVDSRRL